MSNVTRINKVLRDVWAVTVKAELNILDSVELHCRALMSLALSSTAGDPKRAAFYIDQICEDMRAAMRGENITVTHVVSEKGELKTSMPPPPPRPDSTRKRKLH